MIFILNLLYIPETRSPGTAEDYSLISLFNNRRYNFSFGLILWLFSVNGLNPENGRSYEPEMLFNSILRNNNHIGLGCVVYL